MGSRLRGNDGRKQLKKKAGIKAGLNYSHHGKNSGTNRYLGKEGRRVGRCCCPLSFAQSRSSDSTVPMTPATRERIVTECIFGLLDDQKARMDRLPALTF
jgi:hypothetical protein